MKKEDMEEFTEILDFLAEGLGTDMTAVKYKFYFAALSDLPLEDIKSAANQIARTATFFPKPVDFRNALAGDVDTKTVIAWEKVMRAKPQVGSYSSVKFDDPVIHTVISMMGGWVDLCRLEGFDTEKWQRHEFEKTYKAMIKLNAEHPEFLLGANDADNKAKGYVDRIGEPMLIGDVGVKQIELPEE